MRIGLTYDLRSWYLERGYTMDETAEFDKEETVNALADILTSLGYEADLVGNAFQLIEKLAGGEKWDMVFNIAEGLYGDGRESLVPALLDQYKIPYVFSGPVVMGLSLNKHIARLVVSAGGVPVSPGTIISEITQLNTVSGLVYPLFVKPVAEGTGKGITARSIVKDKKELASLVTELLQLYHQPVLVEEYLPGREFTVGVTGSGEETVMIGGMEVICKDNLPYSVEVKENYYDIVEYRPISAELTEECREVAVNAWKALNAVDAGRVDLRTDRNGRICFIEANPLAGLNPVHSDLPILARMSGVTYEKLIETIMTSARKRYNI